MTALDLAISDLTRALRSGELDLLSYVDAALARIDERDGEIKALLPEPERRERLHERARELQKIPAAERPPLFGVLVGVKDIMKVSGLPMRAGSQLPEEVFEGPEAWIVTRLRELGAVVLGRTVTTEFAYFTPGPTRNPRGLGRTPGGSSSGSAAAVAAGYGPLALGTQTIGSVSRPAAFCGVVGVKPSAETISREGVFPFSRTADQLGYFVRSVADAEFILPLLVPGLNAPEGGGEATPIPRFAVPHENYLAYAESAGREQFNAALARLSNADVELVSTSALEEFESVREAHRTLIAGEFARVHSSLVGQYESRYSSQSLALVREGENVGEGDLEEARQSCLALRRRLDEMLDELRCEAWLSPAAPSVAPQGLERTGDPVMNLPWTHAGVPTLSIPSGATPDGLPFGLQVAGRFRRDHKLMGAGRLVESLLAD